MLIIIVLVFCFQIAFITLYTAIRYRDNLRIFDHHDDGLILSKSLAEITKERLKKGQQPQQFDIAEVTCVILGEANYRS